MYLINSDTYKCDSCGIQMRWDESSESHGEMWGCEVCEKHFCSKCLKDKVGKRSIPKLCNVPHLNMRMTCYGVPIVLKRKSNKTAN